MRTNRLQHENLEGRRMMAADLMMAGELACEPDHVEVQDDVIVDGNIITAENFDSASTTRESLEAAGLEVVVAAATTETAVEDDVIVDGNIITAENFDSAIEEQGLDVVVAASTTETSGDNNDLLIVNNGDGSDFLEGQDGSDLLIVNNGDGSDFMEDEDGPAALDKALVDILLEDFGQDTAAGEAHPMCYLQYKLVR